MFRCSRYFCPPRYIQGERTARVQSELGGSGIGGYQVSEMCRCVSIMFCWFWMKSLRITFLTPPLSQAAEMTAVQSKGRHEIDTAKLQSFPASLMTSTELSTQKGNWDAEYARVSFCFGKLTHQLIWMSRYLAYQEDTKLFSHNNWQQIYLKLHFQAQVFNYLF